jgi:hypothetical protein
MPAAKAAEIRAAYDSPMSVRECAIKFGLARGTITRAIKAAGGTLRPNGPIPRAADPAAVKHAYVQERKTLREVSHEFRISERAATAILRDAGVQLRRGPRLRPSGGRW